MPWNAIWPVGTVSVKSNKTTGNQNTSYIETTMGNSAVGTNTTSTRDHFWNVGSDEDGRHRFVQSPAFTVGGSAADVTIGTGMDSVFYAKTVNSQVQWFNRNSGQIWQATPNVLTASVAMTTSYANVVAVPASCYGEIFAYDASASSSNSVRAYFRSSATLCRGWSLLDKVEGSSTHYSLEFANVADNMSGLNLRAKRNDGAATTWNFIITYRDLI